MPAISYLYEPLHEPIGHPLLLYRNELGWPFCRGLSKIKIWFADALDLCKSGK